MTVPACCRSLLVTLAGWGRVVAVMEQVGDQRDLTFKIKTNDALVVFVGEKKGSQEEATFRQVAQDMAPDGGIMFAVAFDAKIAQNRTFFGKNAGYRYCVFPGVANTRKVSEVVQKGD